MINVPSPAGTGIVHDLSKGGTPWNFNMLTVHIWPLSIMQGWSSLIALVSCASRGSPKRFGKLSISNLGPEIQASPPKWYTPSGKCCSLSPVLHQHQCLTCSTSMNYHSKWDTLMRISSAASAQRVLMSLNHPLWAGQVPQWGDQGTHHWFLQLCGQYLCSLSVEYSGCCGSTQESGCHISQQLPSCICDGSTTQTLYSLFEQPDN